MAVDEYEIVGATSNLLITKSAIFDVTGDVSFSYSKPHSPARQKRDNYRSSSHFYGNGGSFTYSTSHIGGLSNSGHSTYGHPPSNNRCASILASLSGFSHSSHMSFGHNHDHSSTSYLYTTHGTSHYSPGASMHYCYNKLNMHVHNHMNEHYHVSAPFYPKPNVIYNICSSFR